MFLFFLTSYIHQKVCLFNFLHPSLYFVAVTRSVSALGMGYRGGVENNNDSDGDEGESYRGHGDGASNWHANFGGGGGGE